MKRLLQINTSLFAGNGQSSQLANAMVAQWRQAHPDGTVQTLDLAQNPIPHLTAESFQAFIADPAQRNERQRELAGASDALIEQLRAAEVIVLGLPMYNFGIPSTLKAYFDHIARAGITFRYTATGPVGLLHGKKAFVFAARGGLYHGTPADTQTQYVKDFLKFIGIIDVEFVYAEGLALDADKRRASLDGALAQIPALAA